MKTETKTSYGSLRGEDTDGLAVFKGIPYARPPLGPLRFRAPQPPERWDGVRDATRFGPAAMQPGPMPQRPSAFGGMFGAGDLEISEDCLYLNVWTPGVDTARRPVMVFIHGGAFRIGTSGSPMYNAANLARRGGVVVVTANYRLGALGFLYLPELEDCNFGSLDQVAALQWVRQEISAFGGDPTNVTVFGESAGAKSVEVLLAMPAARGLFERAIMQSTYHTPMDTRSAETAAETLLTEMGLSRSDPERLRSVPAQEFVAAQVRLQEKAMAAGGTVGRAAGQTAPVVDGDVLPQPTLDAITAGVAKQLPVIVGTNRDESRLFGAMAPGGFDMTEESLRARVGPLLRGAEGDSAAVERATEVYASARGARGEPARAADIYYAISTDSMFGYHSTRLAEAQSNQQPATFRYLFSWPSPAMDGALGACHGLELPFVFGNFDGPLGALAGDTAEAHALSARMQDAWLSFARTGNPGAGWPAYDVSQRATMVFGARDEVATAPLDLERQFWAGLEAQVVPTG